MGELMSKSKLGLWALAITVGLNLAPAQASDAAKMSVNDIRSCMAKNLAHRGALRDLNVGVADREGKVRSLKMKLFWKPAKNGDTRMNLRVLDPLDLKGSAYLLLGSAQGEKMYFYMPASQQVQEVSGQASTQPLWGTDFSYGEIKQVHGMLDTTDTARKADATALGRKSYVLESTTAEEKTGYSKILSYVDQQSCVLLKSEFIGKNGKPAKLLEGDTKTLFQIDDYWVMLNYSMSDLRKKTKTTLAMSELTLLEGSRESMFDPKTFYSADDS